MANQTLTANRRAALRFDHGQGFCAARVAHRAPTGCRCCGHVRLSRCGEEHDRLSQQRHQLFGHPAGETNYAEALRHRVRRGLARLASAQALHRFMFVTDPERFRTICRPSFSCLAPGVEVVDLVTDATFICPLPAPPA
jgi:hypothetical protein